MIPMNRDWSSLRKLIWLRGNPATGGGGGSPLTVSGPTPLLMPGAVAKPLRKATFSIEAVQAGTGDPSPSNVRPITGHQSMTAWVTGKNLLDPDSPNHWVINSANAKVEEATSRSMIIPCKQGEKYTISCQRKSGAQQSSIIYYAFADANGNILSRTGSSTSPSLTVTAPANTAYLCAGATHVTDGMDWVQLEVGTTASPYTPYSGTTVSVEFPDSVGTVYSGTIDPVTGEGVVTHKCVTFDGNTDQNEFGITVTGSFTQASWIPFISTGKAGNDFVSDKLKTGSETVYGIWGSSVPRMFMGLPTSVTDKAGAVAWFADNPVTVVYPLADPIPFTLAPQSLTPPAGDAYIWADCGGSAEVTYIGKA